MTELSLEHGELMVIYSDGVSEATDAMNAEYGAERLRKLIGTHRAKTPIELLAACRDDLTAFRLNCQRAADDATLFVLARSGEKAVLQ
jgi:sigma-B regulation protein RsbU (phosphoserine phosphatase)